MTIVDDDRQGHLTTVAGSGAVASSPLELRPRIHVSSLMGAEPGDQTVPQHSADHQLRSGKFKGVFQQFGYERQGSYQNPDAIACTLFSLVRILEKMVWSK